MASGSTGPSLWRKAAADGTVYVSALTGVSQVAFPSVDIAGCRERLIANPSLTAYIYVNVTGDPAVANGAGTIPIPPLGSLFTEASNAMTVIGTNGQPITIRER
jgi:hypothetical protein